MSKVRISGLPAELYSPISDDARAVWDYPDGRTYKARPAVMAAEIGRRARADSSLGFATIDPITGKLDTDFAPWTTVEKFEGFYNADTNTPSLADGTGTDGAYYRVTVGGDSTPDGTYAYQGDRILYSAQDGVWKVLADRAPLGYHRHVTDPAFGADPNGLIESADAIQAALDAGDGVVYIDAGTYRCSKRINIPRGVDLKCASGSLLDFSHNLDASLNSLSICVMANPGTQTALPDLASDVEAGDSILEFTSAPSLVVGDVVTIYNPTDYSFNGHRDYYRQGESFEVRFVDGTTVGIAGACLYAHSASVVDMYKTANAYEGHIDGLRVKGVNDGSNTCDGLGVVNGVRVRISNCKTWNCSSSGAILYRCFDLVVDGCSFADNHDNDFGLDYGLQVLNCTGVRITNSTCIGARHGLTFGGSSNVGDVPCRHCQVTNNQIHHTSSTDNLRALNVHGNCERFLITGNHVFGGMDIAGDWIRVYYNFIYARSSGLQAAIFGAEFTGYNFDIRNNYIFGANHGTANEAPIMDTRLGLQALQKRGGTFYFCDNHCEIEGTETHAQEAIFFKQRGYVDTTGKVSIVARGNTITTDGRYRFGIKVATEIDTSSPWESVDISHNKFINMCGPNITDSSGGSIVSARHVKIDWNVITNADDSGANAYSVVGVSDSLSVQHNEINSSYAPALIQGTSGNFINRVIHKHNTYNNCPWGYQSATPAPIRYRYAQSLIDDDNVAIGLAMILVVYDGTQFAVGNTIEGATSGATATVYAIEGNRLMLKDSVSGGPFQITETVTVTSGTGTGNTSGAAGAESAAMTNDRRFVSDITNAWRGAGNISINSVSSPSNLSPLNAAAITNDLTLN